MQEILLFLVLSLKTIDGNKDSAEPLLSKMVYQEGQQFAIEKINQLSVKERV